MRSLFDPVPGEPASPLRRPLFVAVIGGFALLRAAEVLSADVMPWDHEFHELGRLALDLQAGEVRWSSFFATYQYHAPRALVATLLHALLSVPFGPTSFTLRATSTIWEIATVLLLARFLLNSARPWVVAVALLPWLLPTPFAREWLISPYSNHTEFLVLALALLTWAVRPPKRWPIAATLTAVGVFLYPPLMVAVGAAAAAWLLSRRGEGQEVGRRWLVAGATVGGAVLLGFAVLYRAVGYLPAELAWNVEAMHTAWTTLIATQNTSWKPPPVGPEGLHIAALALAAIHAIRPGPARPAAAFAVLYWIGALLLAGAAAPPATRYYLPAYFACLLAAAVSAAAPKGAWKLPGLVLCCALAWSSAESHWRDIKPDRWAATSQLDTLGLTRRLDVYCATDDELPYFAQLLRERRGSKWTGALPGNPHPERICGHREPLNREGLQQIRQGLPGMSPTEREAALRDAGAGGWIRHGRRLPGLQRHLDELGIPPETQEVLLRGAQDEAAMARPFE